MKPPGSFLFEKCFSSFLPNFASFLVNIFIMKFLVYVYFVLCVSVYLLLIGCFIFLSFRLSSQVYIIMAPSEAKARYMPVTLSKEGSKEPSLDVSSVDQF